MSEPTRSYSNGEIIVEWRPELCVHCEACVNGLPQVFNMSARPWVNVSAATTKQIVNQVNQCPDAALSIRKAQES